MQSKLPRSRLVNAFTGLKLKAGSNTPKVASADGGLPASKSITSRLRFLRPRQATVLSGIKITATIAGKVGAAAPVPVIQPIADGVKQIVDYCETVRKHKKECIELKDLVVEYADVLEQATAGMPEAKMDEHLAYSLAMLEDNLMRIRDTMQKLSRKSIIKHIVSSSEHADLLSEHRRQLQDDMSKFQAYQTIRSHIGMCIIKSDLKELASGNAYLDRGRRPGSFFLHSLIPYARID